jgi:hypothetical protein
MARSPVAHWLLEQEARALLTRLARVRPFALSETVVPAAALYVPAQAAIERYLAAGRWELRERVYDYLRWLRSPAGRDATPEDAHRRFAFLRLRFNVVLSHFDVFSEVLTQRSEAETGVFLSGLDTVAADALELPGNYYEAPPVICYLQRGHGASIRRARTRLPGGGENPVAIVMMPRERMIGSGIASSLVHEVGHQGSALLDLIPSLRTILKRVAARSGAEEPAWRLFDRWISEIISDFWAVAKVGVSATLGLMGVVALPRPFVFRMNVDDPHPTPWIRVKLSCAMGKRLYPHPQWDSLARLWESFYPLNGVAEATRQLLVLLESTIPRFVTLLVNHRAKSLRGRSLGDVLASPSRQPTALAALYQEWQGAPIRMRDAAPSLVFAVIGQAKLDGRITPEEESRMLAYLLTHWALRSTLDTSEICAAQRRRRLLAPAS